MVDLNGSALEESISQLSENDRKYCHMRQSDVTQEASVEAYVAEAMKLWGTLDISVQNAGVASPHCSIMDTDSAVWNKTMDVNGLGGKRNLLSLLNVNRVQMPATSLPWPQTLCSSYDEKPRWPQRLDCCYSISVGLTR